MFPTYVSKLTFTRNKVCLNENYAKTYVEMIKTIWSSWKQNEIAEFITFATDNWMQV